MTKSTRRAAAGVTAIKRGYFGGASVLAVAATLAIAGAARAEDKPATVDEVVVTGSFIAGTPKDSAIPVAVIGRQEIEERGSPSILDIIKTLPIVGGVLGETNSFSTASQGRNGGGTINLRGLGPQRTLVLLNGRRFAGYTADTNLIPAPPSDGSRSSRTAPRLPTGPTPSAGSPTSSPAPT